MKEYKNLEKHCIEMQKDLNTISNSDRIRKDEILVIIQHLISLKEKKELEFELEPELSELVCSLKKVHHIRITFSYLNNLWNNLK